MVECAVDEIDSDDAQGLLLINIGFIEHAHMDDDLVWLGPWLALEPKPKPAMCFASLFETAGSHGVGKNEEGSLLPEFFVEPLEQQPVFVIQHCLQPGAADITVGRPINSVAERHVVSRHGLGDRSGCSSNLEETARHFLSCSDLGERSVFAVSRLIWNAFLFVPTSISSFIRVPLPVIGDGRKFSDLRAAAEGVEGPRFFPRNCWRMANLASHIGGREAASTFTIGHARRCWLESSRASRSAARHKAIRPVCLTL